MILPFTDCFGETILPKGWKLNEAGEKPYFRGNGLADVDRDDSKDTFACRPENMDENERRKWTNRHLPSI